MRVETIPVVNSIVRNRADTDIGENKAYCSLHKSLNWIVPKAGKIIGSGLDIYAAPCNLHPCEAQHTINTSLLYNF
jgi:hypothetical protein